MPSVADTISKYQEQMKQDEAMKLPSLEFMDYVGNGGIPTRGFFIVLAQDLELQLQFCMESGLLLNEIECETCGKKMNLSKSVSLDGKVWQCGGTVYSVQDKVRVKRRCGGKKSVRYKSWFSKSHLRLEEILLLTYEIVTATPNTRIGDEYFLSPTTISEWTQFVREVMLDYIETNSTTIGGQGVVVEIEQTNFRKRKDKIVRSSPVDNWVFGGVETSSGKSFMVVIHEKSPKIIVDLITKWIEPGSSIVTDSWKEFKHISRNRKLTVDHRLTFVSQKAGLRACAIEQTWNEVKEGLPKYNRQKELVYYLAEYMFKKQAINNGEDAVVKFLDVLRASE